MIPTAAETRRVESSRGRKQKLHKCVCVYVCECRFSNNNVPTSSRRSDFEGAAFVLFP